MDMILAVGHQTLVHRLVQLFNSEEFEFFPPGIADEVRPMMGRLGWLGVAGGTGWVAGVWD
jgi:hypothetical protein